MSRRFLPVYVTLSLLVCPSLLVGQNACEGPWTLEETLRIGSIAGDVTLSWINDLVEGPGGKVYVAQQFRDEITVFTADGRREGRLGRSGSGPGEFEASPQALGWRADTLWASNRFLTQFFGPDGKEHRRVVFRAPRPSEISTFVPGTPLADGSFLGKRLLNGKPGLLYQAERVPLRRFSESGEELRPITLVEQPLASFTIAGRKSRNGDWDVLYAHPLAATLDGEGWLPVVTTPDKSAVILVGGTLEDPGTFDLLKVAISGDTLLRRTVAYDPLEISAEEKETLTEGAGGMAACDFCGTNVPGWNAPQAERARQRTKELIRFPKYHPPVRKIVAGEDGSIWLLRETTPRESDVWEIYGPEGKLEGSITIHEGRSNDVPWYPRLRVLRATRDEVWGMTLGDFDEPYIHKYAVNRPCS